jgi:hypothetical protein
MVETPSVVELISACVPAPMAKRIMTPGRMEAGLRLQVIALRQFMLGFIWGNEARENDLSKFF